MTEAQARDILNDLARLTLGGGWPDREALRRFRERLEQLKQLPEPSAEFVGALTRAEYLASILFDDWGRVARQRKAFAGPDEVRDALMAELVAIRALLPRLPGDG